MKRFIVAMLLVAFVSSLPAMLIAGNKQGAPNFKLTDQNGKSVELAKLKGKVVVVNFWATWCGPCKMEIPGFLEVYGKYKGKGLEIVGVSLDRQGWDVVKPYIAKANIVYPVVIGDNNLTEAYGGIEAIPSTFIVDKTGKIIDRHVGYMSAGDFEAKIKPLL